MQPRGRVLLNDEAQGIRIGLAALRRLRRDRKVTLGLVERERIVLAMTLDAERFTVKVREGSAEVDLPDGLEPEAAP